MRTWLTRFSLKTRLLGLLGLLATVALGLTLAGLSGMRQSNAELDRLYNQVLLPVDKLADLTNHMHNARSQLLLALQHRPGSVYENAHDHAVSQHFDAVENSLRIMQERIDDYQRLPMSEQQLRLVSELQRHLGDYLNNGVRPVLSAMRQGDYVGGNGILLTRLQPAFMTTYASVRQLTEQQHAQAKADHERADQQFDQLLLSISLALGVAVLLVSLIAAATLSGITQAVQALRRGGEQLAEGNLRHRVDYQGHDELGDIASAFNGMAARVQHSMQELAGAVEQLAAAAEQTAQVSHQTSDGIRRQQLETDQVATAMHEMSATVQDVAGNAASAAQAAEQADQQAESGKRVVQQTISALVRTIEETDPYLAGHSRFMASLSSQLGKALCLSDAEVATVEAAANLSQIGKMFVPKEILTKPGALTDEEKKIMEGHVEHSRRVLQNIEFDLPIVDAIYEMNERVDGTGYPRHLSGDEISIFGRLLAVTNAFTAMVRPRSYRAALEVEKILQILKDQASFHYDAAMVEALGAFLETPAGERLLRSLQSTD